MHPRIPTSTYRLQFNQSFTFQDAKKILPYLKRLGISDVYASPFLKATPGSTHGYDIVDPTQLNPEIGTEKDFLELASELQRLDLGHILDVVPNHMGIGKLLNPWWQDVLENGPSSPYANFFDIDWRPIKRELENKVLLPILGDLYGTVLENQEIRLNFDADRGLFYFTYFENTLPVSPKPWANILTYHLDALSTTMSPTHPHLEELRSIITALDHLPPRREPNPHLVTERLREKEIIKRRLATLARMSPPIHQFILENVKTFNGTKGDPRSFDLLDTLLDDQAYRLAYWRVASEEINYRRFFDVNELASIRMEDPRVFQQFHGLIFRLLQEGAVTGLRIDHVDGLNDPSRYLHQLQEWAKKNLQSHHGKPGTGHRPLFVVVEKILSQGETLPETWPIFGTTGYDFLNVLNGLFINGENERSMDTVYERFIQKEMSLEDLVYETNKLIMRVSMASEINTLGHQLNRLSERDRSSRDFTLSSLTHAIREIIACFPVYRTYVTEDTEVVTEQDWNYIVKAVRNAKKRNPALSGLVFDFVRDLLLHPAEGTSQENKKERQRFITKFQQFTSPVTAKGYEDTAFYLYNRLISLNEVGGDPGQFGVTVADFHRHMGHRMEYWPHAFSTTSTHDTKRGEDVRARINTLSEIPKTWKMHVTHWARLNKKFKTDLEGRLVPDRNEEYLLYQTLLGSWPFGEMDDQQFRLYSARIQSYMEKALKESKAHTSWVNPNQAYHEAVSTFVERILDRTSPNPFLEEFTPFQRQLARWGIWNSLSQVVLKSFAPGIPDFYQGTELWDLYLVDPDNRQGVDYGLRANLLSQVVQECAHGTNGRLQFLEKLLDGPEDGRLKLFVTYQALRSRLGHGDLMRYGGYIPLTPHGNKGQHLCAFARQLEEKVLIAVVPRLVAGLLGNRPQAPIGADVWENTWISTPPALSGSRYRNIFTEEEIISVTMEGNDSLPVDQIFSHFPVAILEKML